MKLLFNILFLLLMAAPGMLHAQERSGKSKHEEIEAIKAAFITKKLDLTSEEAKAFWPVYNDYQRELSAIIRERRQNFKSSGGNPSGRLNADFDFEGRVLALKKSYQKEFAKVLPPQKVLTLYRAEREFREQLIRELKERRGH
ncbi:MAG TPA: hypothetical protein VGD92_01445 [Sphingobacteriaceae bacterium]